MEAPTGPNALSPETLALIRRAEAGEETLILDRWHAGRCAICGRPAGGELVDDHDHQTGLVRGYLCRSCNTREGLDQRPVGILGKYREMPPTTILQLTIRYLDPYTGQYAQPRPAEQDPDDGWGPNNPLIGIGL